MNVHPGADRPDYPLPPGFLVGASTAAHQIEGNNLASDWWALETRPNTFLPEPSGDAVDGYHRCRRTPKPSLAVLGNVARRLAVPG